MIKDSATARENRIHEFLPWYLNGTLSEEEAATFRAHLPGCETCRREIELLEQLRGKIAQHGDTYVEDHPPSEQLVALVREELEQAEALVLTRHLAICETCALETRWIRGESIAEGETPAGEDRRSRFWRSRWAWAVAAALLLVLFAQPWRPFREPSVRATAAVRVTYLDGTERTGGASAVVRVAPGEETFRILFEVDLAEAAYPVRLDIVDERGRSVHRQTVGWELIHNGAYLFVDCERRDFADGDFNLRVIPTDGQPDIELPFRVVAADPPGRLPDNP